ncbi:MAG: hypothetical protein V1904_08285 [Bacteroidota bacterium]
MELTLHLIDELKSFYAIELKNIQRRADEIKGIIKKLETMTLISSDPATSLNKTKLKTKVTDHQQKEFIEPKTRKTKNPNWTNYVIEALKEQGEPMSVKDMLKAYEKRYNINVSNSKRSIGALSKVLQRLRVNNNRINNIKVNGQNEKLYGLVEWTDKSVSTTPKAKKTKPLIKVNQKPKTIIKLNNKPPLTPTNKWTKFIFETLNKTKRVLSAKDFSKYAMVYFNLPKHEMETTRVKLSPALSRLEIIVKSLKTCKKDGQSVRFYGLPDWFDDNNKLISDYK